ncbi:hypothetical protein HDV00_001385 [Rhizophlyctis rosea]|nr:hypothetical protein HDV00_001385 [Rhizophlyctis rosea]
MTEPVCEGDSCKLPPNSASTASPFIDLLKEIELSNPADETKPSTTISKLQKENKIIGLYFSAQWCPPCRSFSPTLSQFASQHSSDFAVIYISQDRSPYQMTANLLNKHFYAIPYDHPSISALSDAVNLVAIPTLAILSPEGKLLTTWGRAAVSKNSAGAVGEWREGREGVSWWQMLKFWA